MPRVHLLRPVVCAAVFLSLSGERLPAASSPAIVASARATTTAALPRSTPEAQGLSSAAVLAFVEAAEQKIDALHSLMIVRHGRVIAEGWWAPYAANEPHMMFSLSKSFTSTAVGLAVEQGKLAIDDPVLKFFPDEAPADPSANLKAMRVRDLLTMSTGHHEEAIRDFPYQDPESVVKRFLALPVAHKPGTFFVYNTPATYMLSAIVQKVTGQTVLDYLGPRLFAPLGIASPTWEASPQGISMGGFGLSIRTEDIARFGQLYLQKGQWQGRPLIPASWVEAATSRQMSNGSSPASDWEQGYGYQFWRARHGFYRGDGAHGQFCIILPQYDTVLAFTAGTRDMAGVMNLAWEIVLPALTPSALPADAAAQTALKAKLASLTLRPQTSTAIVPAAGALASVGRRFAIAPSAPAASAQPASPAANAVTLDAVALEQVDAAGRATITLRIAGADQRIEAAPGTWTKQTVTLRGEPDAIAASGAWTAADTYTLKVVRYRTPFTTTYTLRLAADQVMVKSEQNVGPPNTLIAEYVGKPAAAAGSRP